MAILVDKDFISREYSPFEFVRMWILQKLAPIRLKFRHYRLKNLSHIPRDVVTPALNKGISPEQQAQFLEQKWVFIEDFFEDKFFQALLQDWPSPTHFRPVQQFDKSYDNGLIDADLTFSLTPILAALNNFLDSRDFSDWVSQLSGDRVTRQYDRLVVTRAFWGSRLAPHLDAVSSRKDDSAAEYTINFLYFLDASGGPNSGGTCIYSEDGQTVEFEVKKFRNTCLIYDACEKIHGFPMMQRGKYRKMISFNMTAH